MTLAPILSSGRLGIRPAKTIPPSTKKSIGLRSEGLTETRPKQRDAAPGLPALGPVDLLVDHAIDAGISAPLRHARAGRIGQQCRRWRSADRRTRRSGPSRRASASSQDRCHPCCRVAPELRLADHKGRIAEAEVEAMAVAKLLLAGTRPGRIAVEHRDNTTRRWGGSTFRRTPGVDSG